MNLLLLRERYLPTVRLQANRLQYYRVLAQADRGTDKPLVNFLVRAVESSLTLYLDAVTRGARRPLSTGEWIPLCRAAKTTPYSQEYLSLLARLGRLEAKKIGRVRHTIRSALEAYRRSVAERVSIRMEQGAIAWSS